MAGWNLKEGICKNPTAPNKELWDALLHMLRNTHKTTTYKFCFLKCLLDIVPEQQEQQISFSQIFKRFADIYWELIIKHDLCQVYKNSSFSQSKIEQLIEQVVAVFPVEKTGSINDLPQETQKKLYRDIENYCSRNVVGAFYDSTGGLFYSFSKKDGEIILSNAAVDFLTQHHDAIEELNYYNWAKMLEKINGDNTPKSLVTKMSKLGQAQLTPIQIPAKAEKYRLEDILPWSFKEVV